MFKGILSVLLGVAFVVGFYATIFAQEPPFATADETTKIVLVEEGMKDEVVQMEIRPPNPKALPAERSFEADAGCAAAKLLRTKTTNIRINP